MIQFAILILSLALLAPVAEARYTTTRTSASAASKRHNRKKIRRARPRRADRPNGGLYVNETEQANTLTNGEQGKTLIAMNIYGGNPRKDRPEGGFYVKEEPTSKALDSGSGLNPACNQGGTAVINQFGVRRLTPTECERLQGFPDDWTAFGDDGKPISDSARYRMLGNAVCVPTAEWIAERIFKILIFSNKESS